MQESQEKSHYIERIYQSGIIPVVKVNDAQKAVPLAQALLAGGFSVMEITFRTAAAEEAIKQVKAAFPELLLLAGTVINPELAQKAIDSGAQALVSPGFNTETVRLALSKGIPIFPGVATPSEVEKALMEGLTVLKLFPASVLGGTALLQSMKGPFPGVRFIPTGGITSQNVAEYLMQKNVLAVGGTWLTPEDCINNNDWKAIEEKCRAAQLIVRQHHLPC